MTTSDELLHFIETAWPLVYPGQPFDGAHARRIVELAASTGAYTLTRDLAVSSIRIGDDVVKASGYVFLTDCLRRPGVTIEKVARELAVERARSIPVGVDPFRPGARDPGRRRSEPPTPRWARRR